MKIKKNGKVINLTEGDIKKLKRSLIKEQNNLLQPEIYASPEDWWEAVQQNKGHRHSWEEEDYGDRIDGIEEKLDEVIARLDALEDV
tara:strand:+ start:116 stop:376 length:261 start_codon:yes stop_codon:yes gene_type:complete